MSETLSEAFRRGARLFDAGAFFEAHEAWEERWRIETDPACRICLQGLIQVAAAFHKLIVSGAEEPASRLLARGLAKLEACPVSTLDPCIGAFRDELRARALAAQVDPELRVRVTPPRLIT